MKIFLKSKLTTHPDIPFGIYNYDASFEQNPYYIDIREIVREKCWIWLDEIHSSYANVSSIFSNYTRWWWVTAMSRLDVRPWWQENLFKPLLFAKAVLEWIKSNPNTREIVLIGCDPYVAVYLKEFDNTLILEGQVKNFLPLFFIFQAFRHTALAVFKLIEGVYRICKYHISKPFSAIDFNTVVLYEHGFGLPTISGYKYFYGSLFESVKNIGVNSLGYCCIEYKGSDIKKDMAETSKNSSSFFLMDNINLADLIWSMVINIHIILLTWVVALRRIPCSSEGNSSFWFWPNYLFSELGRVPFLSSICSYRGLKSVFKRSPQIKMVVYPYEEKGIERAVLFACQEQGIHTVGYAPHPQYRSALSLRDSFIPDTPKPLNYAVCGSAYVDYFVSWGKKDRNSISVWGSEKSYKKPIALHKINSSHLKILLLISHPNELKVFHSWLLVDDGISGFSKYLVRVYKASNPKEFESALSALRTDFDCIEESSGSLYEDLRQCDITAFCATSAGLIAVNNGYLAIYLDLNDFLEINPCFDNLEAMLPCKSSAEFANRLAEIRFMDTDSITELHKRQLSLVERIFSPIQSDIIKEELSC